MWYLVPDLGRNVMWGKELQKMYLGISKHDIGFMTKIVGGKIAKIMGFKKMVIFL